MVMLIFLVAIFLYLAINAEPYLKWHNEFQRKLGTHEKDLCHSPRRIRKIAITMVIIWSLILCAKMILYLVAWMQNGM